MPDFDPSAYLQQNAGAAAPKAAAMPTKSGDFDPDHYLSHVGVLPPTEAEAGFRGLASGITAGFADELEGAAKATYDKIADDKPWVQQYEKHRDLARERQEDAQKAHPGAYTAGQGVGAITSALGTGEIGATVKGAMAMGALQGAGESKANPLTQEFAQDVGIGAGLGGIAHGVMGKVGGIVEGLPEAAEQRAVKAAVGQNKSAVKNLAKTGKLQSTGRSLLESDEAGGPVVGAFDRTETIAPKAAAKQQFYGKKIGEVSDAIDKAVPNAISGRDIANSILEETAAMPSELPQTAGAYNKMIDTAAAFEKMGDMPFSKAQELKNQLRFTAIDPTQEITTKSATNKMYRIVKDKMEKKAEELAQSHPDESVRDLLAKYQTYKQGYGAMKPITKAAEDREVANLTNRFVSPSDYGTGIGTGIAAFTGGHVGGPSALLAGAAAAGANKLARTYGSALGANAMDTLSKVVQATPEALGPFGAILKDAIAKGGDSFALTHYLLMKKPEYQKIINNVLGNNTGGQ